MKNGQTEHRGEGRSCIGWGRCSAVIDGSRAILVCAAASGAAEEGDGDVSLRRGAHWGCATHWGGTTYGGCHCPVLRRGRQGRVRGNSRALARSGGVDDIRSCRERSETKHGSHDRELWQTRLSRPLPSRTPTYTLSRSPVYSRTTTSLLRTRSNTHRAVHVSAAVLLDTRYSAVVMVASCRTSTLPPRAATTAT